VCRLRGSETGYVEPSAHSQIGAIDPKPTCGDALLDHMEANKAFGGIDILINNAAAYEARPGIC
jgi:NAD(P)-dependent dehydrogenase (short-subunit alcohol dehydrogenase family)